MTNPEQPARSEVDRLLMAAGWSVQDVPDANLLAARGVARSEFPRNPGYRDPDKKSDSALTIPPLGIAE